MNNITICIPTYKRPEMLDNLIKSIAKCNIDNSLIDKVCIIILDNDKNNTAKKIVSAQEEILPMSFRIFCFNYKGKGLSDVRNKLVKYALLREPDFIVFIDDDEYVTSEWLNELVMTIVNNNGDMVMGPVISSFDKITPNYISCWFERPNYLNNTKLNFIRTGNLIIRVRSFLYYDIWFDRRFNATGAEDSYFGTQMIKQGASIYWAANAVVYERISENRANIKWIIKRHFNGGKNYTYILKIENQYLKLLRKLVISLIYIIGGILGMVLISIPIKRKYFGLLKLSEGIGGIAGLLNIKYYPYK